MVFYRKVIIAIFLFAHLSFARSLSEIDRWLASKNFKTLSQFLNDPIAINEYYPMISEYYGGKLKRRQFDAMIAFLKSEIKRVPEIDARLWLLRVTLPERTWEIMAESKPGPSRAVEIQKLQKHQVEKLDVMAGGVGESQARAIMAEFSSLDHPRFGPEMSKDTRLKSAFAFYFKQALSRDFREGRYPSTLHFYTALEEIVQTTSPHFYKRIPPYLKPLWKNFVRSSEIYQGIHAFAKTDELHVFMRAFEPKFVKAEGVARVFHHLFTAAIYNDCAATQSYCRQILPERALRSALGGTRIIHFNSTIKNSTHFEGSYDEIPGILGSQRYMSVDYNIEGLDADWVVKDPKSGTRSTHFFSEVLKYQQDHKPANVKGFVVTGETENLERSVSAVRRSSHFLSAERVGLSKGFTFLDPLAQKIAVPDRDTSHAPEVVKRYGQTGAMLTEVTMPGVRYGYVLNPAAQPLPRDEFFRQYPAAIKDTDYFIRALAYYADRPVPDESLKSEISEFAKNIVKQLHDKTNFKALQPNSVVKEFFDKATNEAIVSLFKYGQSGPQSVEVWAERVITVYQQLHSRRQYALVKYISEELNAVLAVEDPKKVLEVFIAYFYKVPELMSQVLMILIKERKLTASGGLYFLNRMHVRFQNDIKVKDTGQLDWIREGFKNASETFFQYFKHDQVSDAEFQQLMVIFDLYSPVAAARERANRASALHGQNKKLFFETVQVPKNLTPHAAKAYVDQTLSSYQANFRTLSQDIAQVAAYAVTRQTAEPFLGYVLWDQMDERATLTAIRALYQHTHQQVADQALHHHWEKIKSKGFSDGFFRELQTLTTQVYLSDFIKCILHH